MSHYHFNIQSEGKQYQFDLVETDHSHPQAVTIGGIRYSPLIKNPQDRHTVELFLQHVSLNEVTTIKELTRNLRHISSINNIQISLIQKTHKVSLATWEMDSSTRIRIEEQRKAVENGLIPTIPLLGTVAQPASIAERMKKLGVPGASIAVINHGVIEWAAGYGELNKPVLLQGASISKTVNALTIFSLIYQCQQAEKEGRPSGLMDNKVLSLDTDVSTLLDEELWRSIDPLELTVGDLPKMTIRHLLAHTAGTTVSSFSGYPKVQEIEQEINELTAKIKQLEQTLKNSCPNEQEQLHVHKLKEKLQELNNIHAQAFKGSTPTLNEILQGKGNSEQIKIAKTPGIEFAYSGGGTMILQKVIEVLTGQNFEDVVKERIFKPLNMKDSTYSPENSRTIHGNEEDGLPIPGQWNYYPELAAAGLWTTPTDLAKMALGIQQALAGTNTKIFNATLAQDMLSAQTKNIPNGLGVFVERTETATYFFHGGSNLGFRCQFVANTDGQGAVVMTNSEYGEHLLKEVMRRIAHVYHWPDENTLPIFQSPLTSEEIATMTNAGPIHPKEWNKYAGLYRYQDHIVEIKLLQEKVMVQVDQSPPFEVKPFPSAIGVFQTHTPGPLEILRFKESEGSINLILFNTEHKKT